MRVKEVTNIQLKLSSVYIASRYHGEAIISETFYLEVLKISCTQTFRMVCLKCILISLLWDEWFTASSLLSVSKFMYFETAYKFQHAQPFDYLSSSYCTIKTQIVYDPGKVSFCMTCKKLLLLCFLGFLCFLFQGKDFFLTFSGLTPS